jgi:hypothetical protein
VEELFYLQKLLTRSGGFNLSTGNGYSAEITGSNGDIFRLVLILIVSLNIVFRYSLPTRSWGFIEYATLKKIV